MSHSKRWTDLQFKRAYNGMKKAIRAQYLDKIGGEGEEIRLKISAHLIRLGRLNDFEKEEEERLQAYINAKQDKTKYHKYMGRSLSCTLGHLREYKDRKSEGNDKSAALCIEKFCKEVMKHWEFFRSVQFAVSVMFEQKRYEEGCLTLKNLVTRVCQFALVIGKYHGDMEQWEISNMEQWEISRLVQSAIPVMFAQKRLRVGRRTLENLITRVCQFALVIDNIDLAGTEAKLKKLDCCNWDNFSNLFSHEGAQTAWKQKWGKISGNPCNLFITINICIHASFIEHALFSR